MRPLLLALTALTAAGAALAGGGAPAQPEQTFNTAAKTALSRERAMVTAAHPLATAVGRAVLARGGHAVDAAVAVQFMLNLVEPQSSGIGGGAFAVYWDADSGELSTFDGRERAPAAAGEDYFLDPDGEPMDWWAAVIGGRSVGVPGTLKLLDELHQRHGRLPWASLLQPTIDRARAGFAVTERMAQSIAWGADNGLDRFAATKALFYTPDGRPYRAGETLRNLPFAETLSWLARERSEPFYRGAMMRAIIAATRDNDNPGALVEADFETYRVIERPAVCAPYRGLAVCGMGPPSSGALSVGQILMLLEPFDLAASGNSAPTWHLFAEAARLAYADRARYLADADFVPVPVAGLLDREYLDRRAGLIDPARSMGRAEPGEPPAAERAAWASDTQRERAGTSHFNIVDGEGNVLSMTTTIETGFGSRLSVGGFLLNNELTDFSFRPRRDGRPVANRVEGGKRPRSSMAPTIVFDGDRPLLAIGSPGGSRIINYVAQALVGIIDLGLGPQAALDLGHVSNRNGDTELEADTPIAALQSALTAMGHRVTLSNMNSGLHAIMAVESGWRGGADPRRDGTVDGL